MPGCRLLLILVVLGLPLVLVVHLASLLPALVLARFKQLLGLQHGEHALLGRRLVRLEAMLMFGTGGMPPRTSRLTNF